MDKSHTRRILILGKTGSGKSSLANTIFGKKKLFTINHTLNSGTKKCQTETKLVKGRKITLIDTPGFFDTDTPEENLKPEIVKCITECAPGPHAILIVLKWEKFTEHEKAVINKINEYFSEEVFEYATVVFTHGDQLPKGKTIQDFVSQNESVSDLVKKCGGRCHVIDNEYWNKKSEDEYRSNRFQVEELFKTIDKTLELNKGGCYTNDTLRAVEEIKQQVEKCIRQSSGNMSEKEIREKANISASDKFWIRVAGATVGALLGAFFGAMAVVKLLKESLGSAAGATAGGAAAAGAAGATAGGAAVSGAGAGAVAGATVGMKLTVAVSVVGAVVGAVGGGLMGYAAAEEANTSQEAVMKAAEKAKEFAKKLY